MITKFENKSPRVKGLAFHSKRPWILASLHTGAIQLWDYRMGTQLDQYEEHEGPVRGIDFHPSQPIFASGGDDYKFKLWNYKLRRCIFTKHAHMDYIRSCKFHHEYPWVLTASDDQTIRIWNWQSRECISVLTGHTHYVMCASFHPREDLVVSASLDLTVRVWDTSALRKKTVRGLPDERPSSIPPSGTPGALAARLNADWVTSNDAVVKYVLEGHDRGVNWASFHPTLPLIVSGADDKYVKLWRYNDSRAWEVESLRGHTNNVSCAIFHPCEELIISNSEDRSIRVWDISKRMGVQCFKREHDRFWIVTGHSKQNLLAAGHDNGLIVFKLEKERPAFTADNNKLYYCKDKYLRVFEFTKGRDVPVVSMRRGGSDSSSTPRSVAFNSFNRSEQNILVFSEMEGGTYELFCFSADDRGESAEAQRGSGVSAVFTARNRFAVLDRQNNLLIKDFSNQVVKRLKSPLASTEGMFSGGTSGRVVLTDESSATLYETSSRRVLDKITIFKMKQCVWKDDGSRVALISKHCLVLSDRNFSSASTITINEAVSIKSGIWDDRGVFIYTTLGHIKYALPNGDSGVVRTLDVPVYAGRILGNTLFCLDRETKVRTIALEESEYIFKLSLWLKQYNQALRMAKGKGLVGQAIIGYLQNKGFPEVALHFSLDNHTRFDLAIECGNIEIAMAAAYELDEEECWQKLGVAALQQGNHQVVEMAYQKTRNFDGLSFLYLITGNMEKLGYMLRIATIQGNAQSRFHNSLYLGNVRERVTVLTECGQINLAYITAVTHGLNDSAAELEKLLKESGQWKDIDVDLSNASLLLPPIPISHGENWPQLDIGLSIFEGAIASGRPDEEVKKENYVSNDYIDEEEEVVSSNNRSTGGGNREKETNKGGEISSKKEEVVSNAWGGDDLDLDLDLDVAGLSTTNVISNQQTEGSYDSGVFVCPSEGSSPSNIWVTSSNICADHVAAGSFETACTLLHRQIGVINFDPLKPFFKAAYTSSKTSLPAFIGCSSLNLTIPRPLDGSSALSNLPLSGYSLDNLVDRLKSAYRSFSGRQLNDSKTHFMWILHAIPLSCVTKNQVNEVKELLGICREYLTAIRLESERSSCGDNGPRGAELAAYLSHCNLQPTHVLNMLLVAMVGAYKIQNFINAASFARRILELPEASGDKNSENRVKATKVLQLSEKQGRNAVTLNYDDRKPFTICASSLTPIYMGTEALRCPFCGSQFHTKFKNTLCTTCDLSQVGVETLGLVITK